MEAQCLKAVLLNPDSSFGTVSEAIGVPFGPFCSALHRAYQKLEMRNRKEVVARARYLGLIP